MRRTLWMTVVLLVSGRPTWAQQDEIAQLRAQIARQQAVIDQLVRRVGDLENKQGQAVTKEDLEQEAKTQEDAVTSVRETLLGKVNLNGYTNLRYFKDGSEEHNAFQVDHLGLLLGKQLGRFNVFTELELQNVPHHPQISAEAGGENTSTETAMSDISGEGQVAVENAWMEYNHNRYLNVRVGKQLSPQYWWQNHYPNLTYSTDLPIYLRELFPPELVGLTVQGSAGRPVGTSELGMAYKFYVANNDFEGNSRSDLRDGKAWGARFQLRLPASGPFKRFDVAADIYRGQAAVIGVEELADDNVAGFEQQLEVGRFLLNSEYARGHWLGLTRTGFYTQPAVHLSDDWLAFYRLEGLESARIQHAEVRHLLGVNYRPFPQIALKLEYYRSVPLLRMFIHSDKKREPFNGVAAAAVFFF